MPVSWRELEEPRAGVDPAGGCHPADGPDPARAGDGAELAWFGDGGKGLSPCPIPGIPDPSPGTCSEEAWTTRRYASYPGTCAEREIRLPEEAERQEECCFRHSEVNIYIYFLSAALKRRAGSLNTLLCVLLATTSLSFYLFNKGNG